MLLLLLHLATNPAAADAIGPDPEDCPNGSIGTSSHAGEWCEPTTCFTGDGECNEGSCVQDLGLCVTREEVGCGGMRADSAEPCTFTKEEAHGTCSEQADCSVGTCEIASRCGSKAAAVCGCSSLSVGSAALGLALLALGGLIRRKS